ncbi:MAG: hypothetical protein E7612_00965 [Ruminococcaceae bacterium]|nr:hypothetical protein [Oscillospiraceae bacterium]
MKRTVWLWQLFGFAITSLCGTLLHFLYDLTNKAVWAAPFSGVNESTWEHMKLLFWPMFIYAILQSFFFKGYKNFRCVKLRGTVLGLLLIPVIFYTYNGAIGKSPDWINIAIFFVSAALAYIYEAKHLKNESLYCKFPRAAFFSLCVIALLFVIFTFKAPKIDIFKDPSSETYGI